MCKLKTTTIKGKPYVEVNERLKAFRSLPEYKGYSLESDIIELANGVITIKATIRDADGVIKATGLAQEKESASFINKISFVENCETSAWGRALGNLGIGIDTSVASAEEVQNAIINQNVNLSEPITPAEEQNLDSELQDLDIFNGLDAITDMANLKIYYTENKDKVTDIKGFNKKVNAKKKQLGG